MCEWSWRTPKPRPGAPGACRRRGSDLAGTDRICEPLIAEVGSYGQNLSQTYQAAQLLVNETQLLVIVADD